MKTFYLPDLGEGLPDAEIIEWHVAEGDLVKLDEPLVSMETAKAVVEVPSPYTGKVIKQFGQAGDIIETGKPLVEFEVEGETNEIISGAIDEHEAGLIENFESATSGVQAAATVVGAMETSDTLIHENLTTVRGVKVTPAVRALARKLKVDLATVTPSGKGGVVLRADIEQAASRPGEINSGRNLPGSIGSPGLSARTGPTGGDWEPLRGTRRSMARSMSESHAQVVPTSLMDDADIHQWTAAQDMTVRLLRSMWAGAKAEPGLNAWYDTTQNARLIHQGMDVGMAVDTDDGLFVAALRNVHKATTADIRESVDHLRQNVQNRSIPADDLKDYTIMLSNFGMFAGRYATPVLSLPCVCIIAAGKARDQVVAVAGKFESHRVVPLSLTFDHRACTGAEAARFFRAMLNDLALPE